MKKILVLLLFISVGFFAQKKSNEYQLGKVYLKDGKVLKGIVKKTSTNLIKFKKTESSKTETFDYKTAKKLVLIESKSEFLYKVENRKIRLLQRLVHGNLELYFYTAEKQGVPHGMKALTYKVYFIGNRNVITVERLPESPLSKKFIKTLSKYTSNCKVFSKKIKDKEIIKQKYKINTSLVENMVLDYNSVCN